MNVADIMRANVVTIGPATCMGAAARLMSTHRIGMLPVTEGDRVLGVITDRDIVVRGLARGCNCLFTEARVIMTQDVFWCFEGDPIEAAARLLANKHVRRLVVFSRDLRLSGVISRDDIAAAMRSEPVLERGPEIFPGRSRLIR